MGKWEHLEENVKKVTNATDESEYLQTVYTNDGKLHIFNLKARSSLLAGSSIITYDTVAKKWLPDAKLAAPIDEDTNHRGHLFAVDTEIFLFVYSNNGDYFKLLQWKNENWNTEAKLDGIPCCKSEKLEQGPIILKTFAGSEDLHYRFYSTSDGFYVTWESDCVYVARLSVHLENKSNSSATCVFVAKWNMREFFHDRGHVTAFAYSADHKKVNIWGGEQMCDFWWAPGRIFGAKLEIGQLVDIKPVEGIEIGKTPPFAYSGPRATIQFQNRLLMMGGSRQVGLGHCEDVNEIWAFNSGDGCCFEKLNVDMPNELKALYRISLCLDYDKGDIYICDKEQGIFRVNVKDMI